VRFEAASVATLPFADASFDAVVSFETIEHVDGALQEQMLRELRRVLKPGGFLVISSPNKAVYSDKRGFTNEFHVRELYFDEFDALLAARLPATALLRTAHGVGVDGRPARGQRCLVRRLHR
jgi:ubiquinone/menaquinone biosynthesis C-methylase UbiE